MYKIASLPIKFLESLNIRPHRQTSLYQTLVNCERLLVRNSYLTSTMKAKLEIPKEEWHQLILDRTPKSDLQQKAFSETPLAHLFYRQPFLSASSDTHINHEESSPGVNAPKTSSPRTIDILAMIMVSDREGDLPLEDLTDDDDDKPHKSWRDSAVQCIRGKSVENVASLLNSRRAWIKWIEDGQNDKVHIFTSADLPPIGEDSPDNKAVAAGSDTMRSLAKKMAHIARHYLPNELRLTNDGDGFKYERLFLSLEKAVTQCSDMATYVRVSLWLFWASADVCHGVGNSWGDSDELWRCEEILRKYIRNYVALVLLGEQISMDGKALEE